MKKSYFCPVCKTILSYQILDPKEYSYKFDIDIFTAPLCPCKKGQMIDMSSEDYAYGRF